MRRQGAAVAALLLFATTTDSQQTCMGSQLSSLMATAGTSRADYTPDGPVAKRIASVTPYFPFKGIPKFYDIGGFLKDPEAFALVVEVLVERYKNENITSICGLDARGFVLGPPLALALNCVEINQCAECTDNSSLSHFSVITRPCWLRRAVRNRHRHAIEQASHRWRGDRREDSARTRRKILISTQALKKPFFMLRKKGKMPNTVTGEAYAKEYAGNDALSIPRGAVSKGDKVLVIDDLVATGGTLLAAIELIKKFDGTIVECACVVELKFLDARGAFDKKGHGDVPIWAMMSEDILTLDGLADASIPTEGYVDDGEAH